MKRIKQFLIAIFKELYYIISLFFSNISNSFSFWWKQSWKKRIIDLFLAIFIISFIKVAGLIIFNYNISISNELNMFEFIMFTILSISISTFLYLNFAELFIILSLGGVAKFSTECYKSILNRIENEQLKLSI